MNQAPIAPVAIDRPIGGPKRNLGLRERWGGRARRLVRRLDRVVAGWCSASEFGSSIYYAFLNRSFGREHRGVLQGRLRFAEEMIGHPRGSSSLLRRNIHRIEKGLISRPRRELFALDYIEETVRCYVRAEGGVSFISDAELKWARDVLRAYFEAAGDHPVIDRNRRAFSEAPQSRDTNPEVFAPYARDLTFPPTVDWDSLMALSMRRRSVRWFRQESVPRELIMKALEIGLMAPSACNRQPFDFLVFDDPDLVRSVSSLPGGTKGFDHNFPAIIAVVGRLRNYFDERDRHLVYIDASLAVMGLILAAETLGLATCCINWPDYADREAAARQVLRLDPDERPIMFVAVGYPDVEGRVPYSKKKPVEQVCTFNLEGRS